MLIFLSFCPTNKGINKCYAERTYYTYKDYKTNNIEAL